MPSGVPRRPIEERFWPKVEPLVGGCWRWTGSLFRTGYGQIARGGKYGGGARAHRVAYELLVGPIPVDRETCHTCDNRWCVNPTHIFLGTRSDNVRDMYAKGRRRRKAA